MMQTARSILAVVGLAIPCQSEHWFTAADVPLRGHAIAIPTRLPGVAPETRRTSAAADRPDASRTLHRLDKSRAHGRATAQRTDPIDELAQAVASFDAARKVLDNAKSGAQKRVASEQVIEAADALLASANQFADRFADADLTAAIGSLSNALQARGAPRTLTATQFQRLLDAARALAVRSKNAAARADGERRARAQTADSLRRTLADAEMEIDALVRDHLIRNPLKQEHAILQTSGGKPERVGQEHGELAVQLAMAHGKLLFGRDRGTGLVTAYSMARPGQSQAAIGTPFAVDLTVTGRKVTGDCSRIEAAKDVAERLREVFKREHAALGTRTGPTVTTRIGSRSPSDTPRDSAEGSSVGKVLRRTGATAAVVINPVVGVASLLLLNRGAVAKAFRSTVDYEGTDATLLLPAGVHDYAGGVSSEGDRLQITRAAFGEFQQQLKRFEKIQADMNPVAVRALTMTVVNDSARGIVTVVFDEARHAHLLKIAQARAAAERDKQNKRGTREVLTALEQQDVPSIPLTLRLEMPISDITPGRDVSTLSAALSLCRINDQVSERLFPRTARPPSQ